MLNFKQDMGVIQRKCQRPTLLYVLLILGLSENRWIISDTAYTLGFTQIGLHLSVDN